MHLRCPYAIAGVESSPSSPLSQYAALQDLQEEIKRVFGVGSPQMAVFAKAVAVMPAGKATREGPGLVGQSVVRRRTQKGGATKTTMAPPVTQRTSDSTALPLSTWRADSLGTPDVSLFPHTYVCLLPFILQPPTH